MSERTAGETFIADGSVWLCYAVRADGVACSSYVGPVPTAANPTPAGSTDFSKSCAWYSRKDKHGRTKRCDAYVLTGSRYCRQHQID